MGATAAKKTKNLNPPNPPCFSLFSAAIVRAIEGREVMLCMGREFCFKTGPGHWEEIQDVSAQRRDIDHVRTSRVHVLY